MKHIFLGALVALSLTACAGKTPVEQKLAKGSKVCAGAVEQRAIYDFLVVHKAEVIYDEQKGTITATFYQGDIRIKNGFGQMYKSNARCIWSRGNRKDTEIWPMTYVFVDS